MEHPLVGQIARRLIWHLTTPSSSTLAIDLDGALRDASAKPVEMPTDAYVWLWHPVDSDDATAATWRAVIEDAGVRQPFKQAHREVFRRGPEDGTTPDRSHRFSGLVVRQQQFAALCRKCGWECSLQGPSFGTSNALKRLPRSDAIATLEVPYLDVQAQRGRADPFVTIGALRLETAEDRLALPLEAVPPRLLSELMRDVSLVTSVANAAPMRD